MRNSRAFLFFSILTILTISLTACAFGQDLSSLIQRVDLANSKLKTFSARVVQKKYFPDLDDEVTFFGTVVYRKPRQMRWDFSAPDPSTLLIRPEGIWLIVPGIKQVQKILGRDQKKIENFFLGFEKSLQSMEPGYRLRWAGEETLPQGKTQKVKCTSPGDTWMGDIEIWFDLEHGLPVRMRWTTAQGEATTTDFLDIRVNVPVKARTLELNVPQGYETVSAEAT